MFNAVQPKKRGRQKGSKNKPNREMAQKLGEATLRYAHGRYEEVICSMKETIKPLRNLWPSLKTAA